MAQDNHSSEEFRAMTNNVVRYNRGFINQKQLMLEVRKLKRGTAVEKIDIIHQPWIEALDRLQDEQTKIMILQDLCNLGNPTYRVVISCSYPVKKAAFILDVKPTDSVQVLKAKIHDVVGTPPEEQRLYFYNDALNETQQLLSELKILNGVKFRVERYLKVFFTYLDGFKLGTEVGDYQTIGSLRMHIMQRSMHLPPGSANDVRLIYNGRQLVDGFRVIDYHMKSNDCIYVVPRLGGI